MNQIKIQDQNYPKALLTLPDPPQKLYTLGDETLLKTFSLAIVGTRTPTHYGEEITKSLSYGLAKQGVTIISGMAKGIDKNAHIGAMLAKGKTIAVLGSGFNHIYPKENLTLFRQILSSGGLIITEYEKEEKPLPQNFPKRNRIISTLSQGIIIPEAGEKSGSLITADIALDQGKEIFAVPGPATSKTSKGTNTLIKQGAKLTENIFDILEEYEYLDLLPQLDKSSKI